MSGMSRSRSSSVALPLILFLAATFPMRSAAQEESPSLELLDHTGQLRRLEDYRGKVVVLNLWATWCGPCAAEMPGFVETQNRYGDRGVVVLAVSLDDDETKANIPAFMK